MKRLTIFPVIIPLFGMTLLLCTPQNVVDDEVPTDNTIVVTSVIVEPSTVSLKVEDTQNLTVTILPDNATDKTVIWSSSSPEVASISNGLVTAIAEGSSIITASVGDKSATCTVTVSPKDDYTDPGNTDPNALANFDHEVTQPTPGGDVSDGGPQAKSNITSVAGVPLVRLNNGVMMPRFGLGTQVQSMENASMRQQLNETVRGMVIAALQAGYRHLDDAMFYYNERGAGWGIKESGVPREEIWVTSKISGNLADAQNAFNGMLERLQVDYIDLVYIHHPAGTLADILACWRVMEKEYKAGRIRALGISNFDNRMDAFNYIMQNAEIKPQMAQIECHPLAQRTDARELYADNYDVQVECWYPLNHNRGDVTNPTLLQIAQTHGKTVYQVILRWHMQEGLCPVPGSTNAAHIQENIGIFDFSLSDEEMTTIRGIDRGNSGRSFNLGYGNNGFGNFQDYTYNHTFTPAY